MTAAAAAKGPFYFTGGTMPPATPSYVTRHADQEIVDSLLAGELCYVLTARQMGKSSLLGRAVARLAAEGVRAASFELTQIGKQDRRKRPEQWYFGLAYEIHRQLGIGQPLLAWWQERIRLSAVQRFVAFLRELVLSSCQGRVVVVVDEIESTIGLPFADDFFAAIRACYNARASEPDMQRLTFVLVGVASPDQLIRDPSRTPFNVGRRIELDDFTAAEAQVLAVGLHPLPEVATARLDRVLYWTAGQPYLTQALCRALAEQNTDAAPATEVVDRLVAEMFLAARAQREETHFNYMRARLTAEGVAGRRPLRLYLAVRGGRAVPGQPTSPACVQLKLSGLVKVAETGRFVVRNRTYEEVFSDAWARSELRSGRRWQLAAAVFVGVGLTAFGLVQRQRAVDLQGQREAARALAAERLRAGEKLAEQGEVRSAIQLLIEAARLSNTLADPRGGAAAHDALGVQLDRGGESQAATEQFRTAFALAQKAGDDRLEATAAIHLGGLLDRQGSPEPALRPLEQGLKLSRRIGSTRSEAEALLAIGETYRHLAQVERARSTLFMALALARSLGDVQLEAAALSRLAKVHRDLGYFSMAKAMTLQSRALLESHLDGNPDHEQRAVLTRMLRETSDLQVDLLMTEDRRRPGAGYDWQALAVSDGDRVPALLSAAFGGVRQMGGGAVERRRLTAEIDAATMERLTWQLGGQEPSGALAKHIDSLVGEYEQLTAQRTQPRDRWPLSVDEMQRTLAPSSLLLEFHLGERRSFLWVMSRSGLRAFELPPRSEIEAAAGEAVGRLVARAPVVPEQAAQEGLARLSRLLLGQAFPLLGDSQLWIVSDGALERLPFSALPQPDGKPLMVRHAVVSLPSLRWLLAVRRTAARRKRSGDIAVLADPVLSRDDQRAGGRVRGSVETFPRLPYSRREAEEIAALNGGESRTLVATGFGASRDLAISGRLRKYSILHFATHFTHDAEHPELASIVLSLMDGSGRPRDGLVRAFEVPSLDLAARLVVLSGSDTAAGRYEEGDPPGLSGAFLAQGVPQVIGSLWAAGDQSTGELMAHFYRYLLRDRLPAAEALRAAQEVLWQAPRWRSPYYWSGFVLQGAPPAEH